MNRVIASVYAISIGGEPGKDGQQFSDAVNARLVEKIPSLVAEIQRLEKIAHDPFVKGCLHVREAVVSAARTAVNGEAEHP